MELYPASGADFAQLKAFLRQAPVRQLVGPVADSALAARIPAIERELAGAYGYATSDARGAVLAGLWLRAGELEVGHRLCQAILTAHGSAWHAIMHRREGDFYNAKYWWRQARGLVWPPALVKEVAALMGNGPAAAEPLAQAAAAGRYDAAAFVDAVQAGCERGDAAWVGVLEGIQELEWMALWEMSMQALSGEEV